MVWSDSARAKASQTHAKRRRYKRGQFDLYFDGLDEMVRGLDRGIRDLDDALREVLRGDAGRVIQMAAKQRAPGSLRGQIQIADKGSMGVQIGVPRDAGDHPSGVPYQHVATWVESGVPPHFIQPKSGRRKNVLRFDGRFAANVMHPGQRAQRVMGTSLRSAEGRAQEALRRELEQRMGDRMGMQ